MTRQQFRYLDRLRVRWAEVDMQKIVFNGHYLMYIDTAVAGYWRALALPYEETMHQLGGDLFVRKSTLEYLASAAYDDVLDIGVRCERIGNSSLLFSTGVFRGSELLVSGELVYVYAHPVARASRPVPEALRNTMLGFEAGDAMVEVRLGNTEALARDAAAICTEVFVQEQKLAPELVGGAADVRCLQAVAYNRLGMPLSTGRLQELAPGTARISHLAVRRPLRGEKFGRTLLDALMRAALQRGAQEVTLHAPTSAEAFFQRAGFIRRGPVFEEAGTPGVEMMRVLA
jgi:YbgC/YbaW family acyl-CoA thioester hydrolase